MSDLINAIWGTAVRKTITLITGVTGAIIGVSTAWTTLGLPEIATKLYVLTVVAPIKTAQSATTQAVNQLLLAQLEAQLYAAQQDELKSPSPTVEQRITELQDQITALKAKIAATQ